MSTPEGSPDRAAPMAAAPFAWRADGRPDWRSMWTSFCELALFGGPPHRGAEQALRGSQTQDAGAASAPEMVAEMRRGIWETTGLYSELGAPGWIAITCESRAMAEWLGGAIAPENVEVRVEDDRVLLPAGPRFRLENEVKSIITVLAKTHHYGATHGGIALKRPRRDDAPDRHGFRCGSCGLDVHVSRVAPPADLAATCPLDGARMARYGLVTARRSPTFSPADGPEAPSRARAGAGIPRPLKVGVGGSGAGPSALIDALRRRYGRRRAVVTSPAQLIEVNDPAVDLVLVDLGEDDEAVRFGSEIVDATIGVLTAPAMADALRRGDRGLDAWHVLVVSTAGESKIDLSQVERPVVFVDLATGEGIDVVVSWLRRELFLEPWRARRA